MSKIESLTIKKPDDWHLHLRDGKLLKAVLPYSSAHFARAIIMPNLVPPVTDIKKVTEYRKQIMDALPEKSNFTPLMTCYLTNNTDPDELEKGFNDGVWVAAKLFPAGTTTNSGYGVTDPLKVSHIFERLEKIGMPLLIHGEVPDPEVDIFDRELVCMEKIILPILKRHEGLRLVVEHVTNAATLDLVRDFAPRVAGTITAHHLVLNRSSIFEGGINPHLYCLPIAKKESDRLAIRKAATSGEECFFIGTDSAPHPRSAKENVRGKAGIFTAPVALQTYTQVFDEENALNNLEKFLSLNGPSFYRMSPNEETVTLRRAAQKAEQSVKLDDGDIQIFRGGEMLKWSVD